MKTTPRIVHGRILTRLWRGIWIVFGILSLAMSSSIAATTAVEADWLLATDTAAATAATTTQADAGGGCDGVKDGKFGFHTGQQDKPWWQVDLGATQSIARVVIWNRCDAAGRAAKLSVRVSEDGKNWRDVYTHDGPAFFGVTGGKPLEVKLAQTSARYVRVQLAGKDYLHLDEVEVFGASEPDKNIALNKPADQSSLSEWSLRHASKHAPDWAALTTQALKQCEAVMRETSSSPGLRRQVEKLQALRGYDRTREHYFEARTVLRSLLLSHPQFDFDDLLFVKRAPGTFSHMSDQYYGWWSRPGGGVFVLKNWKSAQAKLVNLTPQFPSGSFLKPELSFDGKRVLFSYARFHPGVREHKDKTDKASLPEDAFYHVYEMNIDGSNVRQLTRGRYDDFNARYLPDGEIVFLSTRRGTFTQTSQHCATSTTEHDALPDSYVRCGGGNWRPVAVYTLHAMDRAGKNLRALSPFENFEWDPVVASDGRIIYARWDYVDRDNMPFMSLWSTNPDGTNPQLVYGNHTRSPYGVFEARPIPGSRKLVFTASAHHSISGGSLCLLDIDHGNEDHAPLTRLTPEVCFPEIEGWPKTWYGTPFPLSETLFLTSWSTDPLRTESQKPMLEKGSGLYAYHSSGARELIYRDPEISSSDPIPVRARAVPPVVSSAVRLAGKQEGRFLLGDVYHGLEGVERGTIKSLRVIGVPAKTQPQMDSPHLGMTKDDPGKFVLGTVPVEADGSAYFHVPSGVNIFFQALDARGFAVQTMRTVTYVQPGQTLSCVGCHEHRATTPLAKPVVAAKREPSKLTPGPEGTWPFRFDKLVQPIVDAQCVRCHKPDAEDKAAAKFDLTPERSYDTLAKYGKPSLYDHVWQQYRGGRSIVNGGGALTSALLSYLERDAVHKPLLDNAARQRFVTWLDIYGQRLGSFSDAQEHELIRLRESMAALVEPGGK